MGARVQLPDDADFVVDVPTPPPNMVLVHRASVNREMCDLLGSATDRTQHHHCAYMGPGAIPLRAHPDGPDLQLADGHYDFGYDLDQYYQFGGFIEDIDLFDPLLFGLPPVKAQYMDPQARLFLETAWQAFQALPKPVLVHCSAGYDRTGRVVDHLLRRMAETGAPEGDVA